MRTGIGESLCVGQLALGEAEAATRIGVRGGETYRLCVCGCRRDTLWKWRLLRWMRDVNDRLPAAIRAAGVPLWRIT